MPIFDYKCPACHKKSIDVFVHKWSDEVKCSRCRAIMNRLFTNSAKYVGISCFPSEGIFLEHVSSNGKTFYSKKEMRAYEKEHNITIAMLH